MTPTARRTRRRFALIALLALAALVVPPLLPPAAADALCPQCKAPLEPGAAFCSSCGHKVESPAPVAAAGPATSVVQLVAAIDAELTSAFGSMFLESNVRITSILGTAFAIGPNEFVTDANLLQGAKGTVLKTRDGRSFPAKILGSDRLIGVALLQAEVPGVAPLTLRTGEPPRIGEGLVATGFPDGSQTGAEPVRTAGVISGVNRSGHGLHPIEDYFQTDASLPRGLGGGPLLDARGRVVGMCTGKIHSGIGFAVPAAWVARGLDWIRAGAAPRAWIGALAVPADLENRKRYALGPEIRLIIEQIFPSSPAAAAGLRPGDGLVSVKGVEASGLARLQESLLQSRVGEVLPVVVMRGAERTSIDVTLATRPDNPRLSGVDSLRYYAGGAIEVRDGDTLVVSEVLPSTALSSYKIRPGDVLQSVLSKKDWEHGARDNSRWRSVHTLEELETRIATAYSDLDFCLGLRFKNKASEKKEVLICDLLSPTSAL